MKSGYADVTIILDRSGSMRSILADTIGGFNTFVEDQKKVTGECKMTLVQFDTQAPFEVVRDAVPVNQIQPLDGNTYVPRGGTPLYDAIGMAISAAGERFSKLPEGERPEHVVVVIITDGEENSSREYTREKVMQMIQQQTDTYKWQFVYLGANQNAMQEGAKIGLAASHSMDFSHTGQGTQAMYRASSSNLSALRSGTKVDMSYSDEQRKEAAAS